MANLIGSGINQISVNGMLGNLAFQDKAYVSVDKVGIGSTFVDSGTAGQILQVYGGGAYISGSVGIGSTNPQEKLDVQGGNGFIRIGETYVGYNGITLNNDTADTSYNILSSPSDKNLYLNRPNTWSMNFRMGNGDQMVLNSIGNLGINSSSPTSRLDVVGDAKILGVSTFTAANTPAVVIRSGASGSYTALDIGRTSGEATFASVSGAGQWANDSVVGDIVIRTESASAKLLFTNGVTNSTLAIAGNNVLVGTVSSTGTSSQRLQVTGGAYVSNSVGIGTTNPSQNLHVQGNARVTGAVYDSSNSAGTSGQIFQSTATGTQWVNAAPAGAITGLTIRDEGTIVGSANSVSQLNFVGNIVSVASTAGIATITFLDYVSNAGVSTSVIGGIGSITQLQVTGISTFTNGPVFIGAATSTGTASQALQVNSGAYVSGSLGVGITNPGATLQVFGATGTAQTGASLAIIGRTPGFNSSTNSVYGAVNIGDWNTLGQKTIISLSSRQTSGAGNLYTDNGGEITALRFNGTGTDGSTGIVAAEIAARTENTTYGNAITDQASLVFKLSGSGGTRDIAVERMRLTGAGSLGIGTTNPSDQLHLQGIFRIDRQLTAQDQTYIRYFRQGTEKARFGLLASDNAIFFNATNNDSANHLVINSSGNILVGTATSTGTASQPLQVSGGAYVSGSVGIGTTNPGSKLTVNGAVQIQQDSGSNNRIILRGQPASSYRWNIDNYGSSNDFRIFREDDATAANGVSLISISTTGTLTATKFSGDGSLLTNLPGGSGSSQWVTTSVGIHTLSNVGIGTTNPTSKLTVSGNASITGILTADQVYTSNNGGGQNIRIGDDLWIGDVNVADTTRFSGAQDSTRAFVIFGSSDSVALGRTGTGPLYYGGNFNVAGISTLGVTSATDLTAQQLNVSGVSTFQSGNLKIRNPANTFEYSFVSSAITANKTLTIPSIVGATDTISVLNTNQTYNSVKTFSLELAATGTITLSGAAGGTHVFGSNQTTGTLTLGGTSGTGNIVFGQSTASQTTNIQAGASGVGTTKTINLGTGGLSGSFTQINIGPGPSAGVGTVVINSGTNLLVGTTTSTGTASQPLQVTGGAYVSGPVGVGTINPTNTFDVRGTGYFDTRLGIGRSNSAYPLTVNGPIQSYPSPAYNSLYPGFAGLEVYNGGFGGWFVGVETSGNDDFRIRTSNSTGVPALSTLPAIQINRTTLNVGIGTTNPTSKLHVVGDTLISGIVTASNGIQGIGIYSGGNAIATGIITALNFIGTGNTIAVVGNRVDISISGGGGSGISTQWTTTSSGIVTTANVGVGSTIPSSKLSVVGNALISGIVTATSATLGIAVTSVTNSLTNSGIGTTETSVAVTASGSIDGTAFESFELDDLSSATDGIKNTFVPTFNYYRVTIKNPFRLMITINGVLQSAFINNTDYVYQSNFLGSNNGYTIDSDNNIKFTESIPTGSDIVARVLPVSNTPTRIKYYPLKPTDILLGY